ncbi:class II aldolase/adducin family protein [Leptospira wolffii]|uniref:Class II aldolase/adducin family protein n=1 Tax=Leptospira wolffii TaxID=409998 RepID=A0ABV5BJY7_9LEPT|nr:class II aldolase/adducin family protein [Leptospira wolffii]EPG64393.1 putative L-ribulose-5-phosphate 4-epimerase [Leptospira wolffii serovar Khorat str. Khorat-H2]TGK62502.1 class II aldolase/adducin family protein [Leptospira wolffii]TGK66045.1 class II aldolase/adducin family protein [Leptospira wolffii]TGK74113.1 class II aldolase/adducin family protein [Leptospira wolffii]TGL28972.1 class II aldolase/adducin family protein [Leptospira wolffii]
MELEKAKKLVRDTGIRLVKSGLIARTWGNISQRIDEDTFAITPTGRTYHDLTPDEIVQVNRHDLTHVGKIKPSYEKGLHAAAYALRSNIGAVIHTHQLQAAVVAAAGKDVPVLDSQMKKIIGGPVLCTNYSLPGTKKLIRMAIEALDRSGSKAVLLANHGTLCVGKDMEDAFQVALELERACKAFIEKEFLRVSGAKKGDRESIRSWYLKNYSLEKSA